MASLMLEFPSLAGSTRLELFSMSSSLRLPQRFYPCFPLKASHHPPSLRCSCSLSPSLPLLNTTLSSPLQRRNASSGKCFAVIFDVINALRKPALCAIFVGLLILYDPANPAAFAASGGRIGGGSFSRSSSSYSSRSYSVPPGAGSAFSHSTPYYAPSPFSGGGGFVVGPAFGFGIGGSSLFFVLAGVAAFVLVSGFLSDRDAGILAGTEKTAVLKLQVGLLGSGRSLQRNLNRIADVADTSSPEGLSYILTETTLALLRHPEYCISGHSFVDVKKNLEEGERRFNQLSIEERGKFDEETLVNVNSIKRKSTRISRTGFSNEYIVITILVAAEGMHKLPAINDSGHLKEALQKLGSIPTSKLLAVEVLWTPQNENDILSEQELIEDYPLLRPL